MVFYNEGERIDGSGSSIVIIDTGIDLNHPFFGPDLNNDQVADRIVYQYDFASTPLLNPLDPTSNDDADASDPDGHGSHVASIAASSYATYGGIAPGADIIALKVFDDRNGGSFYDIEQALQWVLENHEQYNIVSVNMSLSTGLNHQDPFDGYRIIGDELDALVDQNIIPVSAAGNEGQYGVSYPAAHPSSLAVSSVDDYNNRRISSFSQHHENLTDVFADGQSITAANRNGGTTTLSGTSMAAPQVSGAIAVAQQLAEQELGRRLTFQEFQTLFQQGDDVLNPNQYVDEYQGKVLNLEKLGNAILAMAPPEDPATSPEDPTTPPEDPTNPPEDPTNPPEDPATPPEDPTTPPEDPATPPEDPVIAQMGQVTDLTDNSQTIVLDHNFINPVIFAQPLSYNSSDPATVRITDIESNSFSVQVQEPTLINQNTHDGVHGEETFSFLVMEQGVWELSDGTIIEVGTITTSATTRSDWQNITFTHDFTGSSAPVVLTQVQTDNDATFVQTRQRNITNNGFELALEEEEAYRDSGHGAETIAWLAISPGQGNWDQNAFIAGNTGDNVTHNWHTINFGGAFDSGSNPMFLGNIASYDGADSSGLRYQNLTDGQVEIKVVEDTSKDDEIRHTTEDINYFAVDATGNLTGSANADALTGLMDQQVGTANDDTFVVGNAQESLYDVYGRQDYLEISGFDSSNDVIQLHGMADNYSLGASPSGSGDQGIFLKVAGMQDELVAIVKNTNTLDLNSSQFAFV